MKLLMWPLVAVAVIVGLVVQLVAPLVLPLLAFYAMRALGAPVWVAGAVALGVFGYHRGDDAQVIR